MHMLTAFFPPKSKEFEQKKAVNCLFSYVHSPSDPYCNAETGCKPASQVDLQPIAILIDRCKKTVPPAGRESIGLFCLAGAAEQISLNKKHRKSGANVIKFLRHFPKYLTDEAIGF